MRTTFEGDPTRYFQGLLQIVNCIYAAACGEIGWEETLAEMCRVGRLDGCALSTIDPLTRRRVRAAAYGLSSAAEPSAMLDPISINPRLMDQVLRATPGAVWQDRQIMPDGLPATRSFWAESAQPADLISWACVVVGRDDRAVVCLELYAAAGRPPSCPELGDFLRQLAPHLTRAWGLGSPSRSDLAMPSDVARAASRPHPGAAPELAGLPEVARLRAEFGLTKAEARLALRLAEGASLASAAQAFNVKLTTIRSQLQQVFAKTGTCRQTELVAMILSRGYAAEGQRWRASGRERKAAALVENGS